MHLPDFVATTECGPPGSEPLLRCKSSLLEDAKTCHLNAGESPCIVGPEMVVLLLGQPILKKKVKLIKLTHSIYINT